MCKYDSNAIQGCVTRLDQYRLLADFIAEINDGENNEKGIEECLQAADRRPRHVSISTLAQLVQLERQKDKQQDQRYVNQDCLVKASGKIRIGGEPGQVRVPQGVVTEALGHGLVVIGREDRGHGKRVHDDQVTVTCIVGG